MNTIKSTKHSIGTYEMRKVTLSCFDDKGTCWKMGSPVMLTVTKTYKVAAEMLVQGEDHNVNDVTDPQRHTPYVLSMRNPKLTVGLQNREIG